MPVDRHNKDSSHNQLEIYHFQPQINKIINNFLFVFVKKEYPEDKATELQAAYPP